MLPHVARDSRWRLRALCRIGLATALQAVHTINAVVRTWCSSADEHNGTVREANGRQIFLLVSYAAS